jgi:hypothetical protein
MGWTRPLKSQKAFQGAGPSHYLVSSQNLWMAFKRSRELGGHLPNPFKSEN